MELSSRGKSGYLPLLNYSFTLTEKEADQLMRTQLFPGQKNAGAPRRPAFYKFFILKNYTAVTFSACGPFSP